MFWLIITFLVLIVSIWVLITLHSSPGSESPSAKCQEGDKKQVGCNWCTCEGGIWSCTELNCEGEPPTCQEGDKKMIECNSCTCRDGGWSCTQKYCWRVDGSPNF